MRGTGLHGHAPCHFAHRSQQGQSAARPGNGFICDADRTGLDQRSGLLRIGSQMQVGVKNLAGTQHGAFLRLRLLDLDDHVGCCKHGCRIGCQFGTSGYILLITQTDRRTRASLYQYFVTAQGQFANAGRRQADTILVILDFLWHTDFHLKPHPLLLKLRCS